MNPAAEASALRVLQLEMQKYLLGDVSGVHTAIVAAPPLAVNERLAIYQNAYRVRLIEALDDSYPKLHAVLGDEAFFDLSTQFLAAHPSVHRSIRWYGAELSQFLAQTAPYEEQPILAELALLEWTLAEVFDAADAPNVGREALTAVPADHWAALRLRFHPSVRRIELFWNTVAVWQALADEATPPAPERDAEARAWLLWRQDYSNFFRCLPADEDAALRAARQGLGFGDICTALREHVAQEQIPLRAAGLLGVWADSAMLASVAHT